MEIKIEEYGYGVVYKGDAKTFIGDNTGYSKDEDMDPDDVVKIRALNVNESMELGDPDAGLTLTRIS